MMLSSDKHVIEAHMTSYHGLEISIRLLTIGHIITFTSSTPLFALHHFYMHAQNEKLKLSKWPSNVRKSVISANDDPCIFFLHPE